MNRFQKLGIVIAIIFAATSAAYSFDSGAWGEFMQYLRNFKTNIIPATDDAYDIGTSSKQVQDIYFSGTIYQNGSEFSGGSVDLSEVDEGIYPSLDNTYDIGSDAKSWKDIYADGTVYGGDFQTTGAGNSRLTFASGEYFDGTDAGIYASGDLEVDGALYVGTGPTYADGFIYGNGSQLTGISASGLSGLTDNYILKADGATDAQDSVMYGNGTNIGIGTTDPKALFELNAASDTTAIIRTGGNNDAFLYFVESTGTDGINFNYDGSSNELRVRDGSDTIMVFERTSDEVGIGVLDPTADLDIGGGSIGHIDGTDDLLVKDDVEVDGNIYTDGIIYGYSGAYVSNTTGTEFTGLFYEGSITPESSAVISTAQDRAVSVQGDGAAYFMGRDVTNDIEFIIGTSSTGAVFAGSMTNHKMQFRIQNNTKMTLSGTGNLGINDDTPEALLDLGSGTLDHIDGANDLYVPDDIEVDGVVYSSMLFTDGSVYATKYSGLEITKCASIETPTSDDNFIIYHVEEAATIISEWCIVEDATSATIELEQCDVAGDNCSVTSTAIICDVGGQDDDGTIDNPDLSVDDTVRLDVTATSGTPGHVTACFTMTTN